MSVHVISWVLKHSPETLGRRLVLLVLADHAREDGSSAWPKVETIAAQARVSERQVQRCLRELETTGSITKSGRSPQGTNVYRVNMRGANLSPPGVAEMSPLGVADMSPDPSLDPSVLQTPSANGRNVTPANPIWDALAEVFGDATTETARSRRGKVCRSLLAAKATPDEIIRRARSWPRHFDDATLTELALEKHWDMLGRSPLRVARN